jgi:UrcA family protein
MASDRLFRTRLGLSAIAVLAAGATIAAVPARSQPAYDDSTAVPGVEVRPSLGVGEYGAPIDWVSMTTVVRADDLNLNSHWGAHRLRVRVEGAARRACDQLEEMNPVTIDSTADCVAGAVERARYDVEDRLGHPLYWY